MLIFRGFLTPNSSKIDHVYWGGNGFGYHWVWIEICGSQNFKWIQLNHQYPTLVAKISSASLTSTLLLKFSLLRFLLVAWILLGFFRCQFLATSITAVQFPIKQVGPCDFGTSTSIMWTHRRVPRRIGDVSGPAPAIGHDPIRFHMTSHDTGSEENWGRHWGRHFSIVQEMPCNQAHQARFFHLGSCTGIHH